MAHLPDIPTGRDLEHFVAALFQASQFFVEKSVVEVDVLELDAVATRYGAAPPDSFIVEVKSGKWGLSDILKVLGKKTYLALPRAVFVVTHSPDKPDFPSVKEKFGNHGVQLIKIDQIDKAHEIFQAEGFPPVEDKVIFSIWRFSYWMEYKLLEVLRAARRTFPQRRGPREAMEYFSLVNNTVFFIPDKLERILRLYEAYQQHPRVTLAAAAEMAGKPYDPESADPDNEFMRQALWKSRHYILQACMYIEHRARLAILKAVVDYLMAKQAGGGGQDERENILPQNCQDAMNRLQQREKFRLYPYFWQTFLWGFGGYILRDKQEEEVANLSSQTGLEPQEVQDAFQAFDWFFPVPGGWWAEQANTQWRLLKLVPAPFLGLGSAHRLMRRGLKEYKEFDYRDFTAKDMARWHNSGVHLLEKPGDELIGM